MGLTERFVLCPLLADYLWSLDLHPALYLIFYIQFLNFSVV